MPISDVIETPYGSEIVTLVTEHGSDHFLRVDARSAVSSPDASINVTFCVEISPNRSGFLLFHASQPLLSVSSIRSVRTWSATGFRPAGGLGSTATLLEFELELVLEFAFACTL